MANLFNLSDQYLHIVRESAFMDAQTLHDHIAAFEVTTPEQIADLIAVIELIKGDIAMAENVEKTLQNKIKTMQDNAAGIENYILEALNEIGEPREDNPNFITLPITGKQWITNVWTEQKPPVLEVVDPRIVDDQYKSNKPEVDLQTVAEHWADLNKRYWDARASEVAAIAAGIENGDVTEAEGKQRIYEFDRNNRPEIHGIGVTIETGFNYR